MANFKLKDGLVVGSNGIIFSDSTVQTTAAAASNLNSLTDVVLTSTTLDDIIFYNGTNWVNEQAVNVFDNSLSNTIGSAIANTLGTSNTYSNYSFTGDGACTVFEIGSGMDSNSVMVFENGVAQEPTVDYNVSGNNVVFTSAPANGVDINVRRLGVRLAIRLEGLGVSDPTTQSAFDQANTALNKANSSFDRANTAYYQANSAFNQANTATTLGTNAWDKANSGFNQANTATTLGTSAWDKANSGFNVANTAWNKANSAFDVANTAWNKANSAFDVANTAWNKANSAFNQANTATTLGTSAWDKANSAFNQANTATTLGTNAWDKANSGFNQANTATTLGTNAWDKANSAFNQANTAYDQANSGFNQANTATTLGTNAWDKANSGFNVANTAWDKANSAFNQANNGFSPTITSPANNDIIVYTNGVWINTTGPFDITSAAFSSKTFNSYVSLDGGLIDNIADLTIDEIVATSTTTTANTANLDFNSTVSSKVINEGFIPTTNVLSGTYGSATQVGQFTVDDKGRITNATDVPILLTTANLPTTGFAAGTYGSASAVPQITTDAYGRTTAVSVVNIAISSAAVSGLATSATTDTTNATNISSGTLSASRLETSGVSSGTYGGSTSIPQIVVDSYGRITSASNVSASSINSFNYHTGNANFEIVTSTGSLTAGIGQHLGTTANPTFNNLVVSGNLTVQGTTTTVSANNLVVKDNLIYLNDGSSNTNVDLGFAGNYNDGTYRHAGLFRDATDGIFKFFDRYTLEPDASANIDVSHASFGFASLKAENIIANSQVIANSYITIDSYSGFSEGAQIIMAWAGATPSTDSSKKSWNIDVDGSNNLRIYKIDAAGSANIALTISNTAGTITAESNWKFAGSGASLTGVLTGTASSSNGASTIVQRDGSGSFTANSITCTTLTETSSITYKENFEILSNPIESLLKLQAYVYDRKDGSRKNEPGLILEDVKDVIPNIVSEDGISYTRLTVYLLEGIKQLKQEIEDLKRKYGDT